MAIFKAIDTSTMSPQRKKVLARFELLITFAELIGGILFVIGSFLFLNEETLILGTWFFIIGSFFFVLRPALKFTREFYLLRNDKF